ncbi:uncharacterized protein LOC123987924 [Osmia bicornis bicornis]|uniref:uncharacterized protein LOC123987924 n=1 Tax=Osmia bicornis bicornis TaxID=1437191 RepID=UPI001EAF6D1C|nr:uncharacterized protein LOC123987924 [Osmia bicornis bicornis]
MYSKQSLSLIKGGVLCLLVISFIEKQLYSEAKPSENAGEEYNFIKQNQIKKDRHTFEMEQLRHTSSCAYVVEPVSKRGYRFAELEELYDIKCVNISQPCSAITWPKHKCMQTFKTIKISNNWNDNMIIYTGCVCAYNHHGSNKTSPGNTNQ